MDQMQIASIVEALNDITEELQQLNKSLTALAAKSTAPAAPPMRPSAPPRERRDYPGGGSSTLRTPRESGYKAREMGGGRATGEGFPKKKSSAGPKNRAGLKGKLPPKKGGGYPKKPG